MKRKTILCSVFCALLFGMAFSLSAQASSDRDGIFEGEVVKLSFSSIVVKGTEGGVVRVREFFPSPGMLLPGKFQIGDRVSVRYVLRLEEILLLDTEGRVQPDYDPNSLQPGLPGVPGVIDDRAFYGAENSRTSSKEVVFLTGFSADFFGT